MKVQELIELLQTFDKDKEVHIEVDEKRNDKYYQDISKVWSGYTGEVFIK